MFRICCNIVVLSSLVLALLSSCAGTKGGTAAHRHGFWSGKPAETWEKALVTGNGTMGVLVQGYPLSDTLILSHARFYMPLNEPLPPVNTGAALDSIRQMLFAGKYGEASRFVVDLSQKEGWDAKRWTDPFVPAFDINIQITGDTGVFDYKRSVDFTTGVASVTWKGTKGAYSKNIFASRADTIIVISIKGEHKGVLNCALSLSERPKDNSWWQTIYEKTSRSSAVSAEQNFLTYSCTFDKEWEGSLKGLTGVLKVIPRGGACITESDKIIVREADEILILVKIEPSFDKSEITSGKLREKLIRKITDVKPDLVSLLDAHTRIHKEIFNRVSLNLSGGDDRDISSEELLGKSQINVVPALFEKEFDAARYNILSSTGIMPPNLQGIWAGTTAPPWSADFTQNGNLQVAISSLMQTNMPELMEAFFRYQESLLPNYRENARLLFNARGIHVASRASTHGLNNHFDRTWPMTFWTAGAAWISQFFYDYYLYTGDLKFLRTRALPFMEEAALFYQDFLVPDTNGKWIFIPSYSPENTPGNSPDQACVNATMDVMAASQLFRNLVDAGHKLSLDTDTIGVWEKMLAGMPAYMVNPDGALREYMWNSLTDNYAHRLASHLYGLWDITDPGIAQNPALLSASRNAINERMKFRRQENGGEMAFGMVQLALAAAAVGDAASVGEMLNWLGSAYWFPNLVTTHNPHELFNLDLSGCFPAVIVKSLVYSEPGKIILLPACPVQWQTGEIQGILLRGQVTLKSLKWNKTTIRIELLSDIDQSVKVCVPAVPGKSDINAGTDCSVKTYEVTLKAGNTKKIKFER